MSEGPPFDSFEFLGGECGSELQRHELQDLQTGDLVRAITETAVWFIEVTGHDDNGCLEGLLTYFSEKPLEAWGVIPLPNLYIKQIPATIGGFLSTDSKNLVIQTQIPGRSDCTTIETASIISLTRFNTDDSFLAD